MFLAVEPVKGSTDGSKCEVNFLQHVYRIIQRYGVSEVERRIVDGGYWLDLIRSSLAEPPKSAFAPLSQQLDLDAD